MQHACQQTQQRLGAQGFIGGCSRRYHWLSTHQNSGLFAGKRVSSIDHITSTTSLGTVSCSCQFWEWNKPKFPDTSQGPYFQTGVWRIAPQTTMPALLCTGRIAPVQKKGKQNWEERKCKPWSSCMKGLNQSHRKLWSWMALQIYLKSSPRGQTFLPQRWPLGAPSAERRNSSGMEWRKRETKGGGGRKTVKPSVGSPPESWIRECSVPWAAHPSIHLRGHNELSADAGTIPFLLIRSNHFEDVRILKQKFEFQGSKSMQYNGAEIYKTSYKGV